MYSIIEYSRDARLTFNERPLTEVDSLLLSQLVYMQFDGIVDGCVRDAKPISLKRIISENDNDKIAGNSYDSAENRKLLPALLESIRFSEVEAIYYVSETDDDAEKQFAAITYLLPDGTAYVAFRGTDASFVGWKEDFMLSLADPVPSQTRAVEYLEYVAKKLKRPLIVGGHSKGGNLAIYAAMNCKKRVRSRLTAVYDHDGPGFRSGVLDSNRGYREIKDRIRKSVPRSSMIGMLLEGHDKYKVVDCNKFFIMQHNPYTWKIENGGFKEVEYVSDGANYVNSTLAQWLETLDDDKRELFIDTLFNVIGSGKSENFNEMRENFPRGGFELISTYRETDREMNNFLSDTFDSLTKLAFYNLFPKAQIIEDARKYFAETDRRTVLEDAKTFIADTNRTVIEEAKNFISEKKRSADDNTSKPLPINNSAKFGKKK